MILTSVQFASKSVTISLTSVHSDSKSATMCLTSETMSLTVHSDSWSVTMYLQLVKFDSKSVNLSFT